MSARRTPASDEDWKISVRLTLSEIVAVTRGEVPASLRRYCAEGLRHWKGSPELAALEARERARGRRTRAAR